MNSARLVRQVTLLVGGSAIVAMSALAAGCSSGTKEEPKTTSTPSSSAAPSVTPTEKSAGGPNSFAPTIHPGQGGSNCDHVSNGVCTR